MSKRHVHHSAALGCAVISFALALALASGPSGSVLAAAAPMRHRAGSASRMLSPSELVARLRAGGCVIVMRHSKSPFAAPDASEADPGNTGRERQLDAQGKDEARAVGAALRALRIPIGPIYSSPTFRALETIRLAELGTPQVVEQLAESRQGMAGGAAESQTAWLRRAVERSPPAGSNTLIVTHTPNIAAAFGSEAGKAQAGEMLVFEPPSGRAADRHAARLLGYMTVADWRSSAR